MKISWAVALIIMTVMIAAPAHGLQMITNGDFGSGDLTGWTIGGDFPAPGAATMATVDFQYLPWSFDSIEFDFIWIGMQHGGGFDLYEYWGGTDFGSLETPGWQNFQRGYDISGVMSPINCTIAFGVTTTEDIAYSTGLFVDNVSVEAVPEPATLLLPGGGLMGMGLFGAARRRKR